MERSLKSRLGLLVVILAMGSGLVTIGVTGYLSAWENYVKVTRADTLALMQELMGEIRMVAGDGEARGRTWRAFRNSWRKSRSS